MKVINVRVIAHAKKNEVLQQEGGLKVRVQVPAVDGKANKALIEVLAKFFKVKKRNIMIIRGERSRDKVVGIKEDDGKRRI